jgi:hypothetical protein
MYFPPEGNVHFIIDDLEMSLPYGRTLEHLSAGEKEDGPCSWPIYHTTEATSLFTSA